MADAWEKREKESSRAFAAFAVYRDQGSHRSITATAAVVKKDDALIRRWSGTHEWGARVHAYDSYLDKQRLQANEAERAAMDKRHIQLGQTLQQLVAKALKAIADHPEEILTTSDMLRWAVEGVKLERLGRGEPVEGDKGKAIYQALWERLGGGAE